MNAKERGANGATNTRGRRGILGRRWSTGALGGGAALGAMLLLLTPAAAAAPLVAHSAPYTGAYAIQRQDTGAQGCGAVVNVGSAPAFALVTGTGTAQGSVRSVGCGSQDSQANFDARLGLRGLPFTVGTGGTYSMTATWNLTWTGTLHMTKAAATAGAQATLEIFAYAYLIDQTAKVTLSGSLSKVVVFHKDLAGAGTYAYGASGKVVTPGLSSVGLVSGHRYAFYTYILADVQTTVPASSGSTSIATGSFDLASAGNGATLVSLVVG